MNLCEWEIFHYPIIMWAHSVYTRQDCGVFFKRKLKGFFKEAVSHTHNYYLYCVVTIIELDVYKQ